MSDEKNKKTINVCWGCNKKEEKGQAPFRTCSKCVEIKVLPSLFCSNECLRENWPRHKEWHKELRSFVNSAESVKGTDEELENITNMSGKFDTDTTNGLYAKLCLEGCGFMLSMQFAEARKKFRKAQKLDPRLPDVYGHLGCVYVMSRQFEEAMTTMEEGVEKWAFVVVTGKYGDEERNTRAVQEEEWGIPQFADTLFMLLEQFTSGQGRAHKKPNWYRRDAVLKRVTRFLVGALRESASATKKNGGEDVQEMGALHKLRTATAWHAHSLVGSIKNGVFEATMSTFSDLPKERTREDLEEAAASFIAAANIDEEDYVKAAQEASATGDKEALEQLAELVTWNAQRMEAGVSQNKSSFYEGCWVVVFGLISPAGKSLNKKLGLVTNANQNQGRLAVQLDGFDEPKSLKTQNLMVIPMADKDVALISCLPDKSQWTCMQPTLKKILPRIPDS